VKSNDAATVSRGVDPLPAEWPTLVATKTGVVVDGKAIVSITNGDVDPTDKEGGVLGIKITRLTVFTKNLVELADKKRKPLPGMLLILDQSLPYRTMIEIVYSVKQAGVKRFGFVVKSPKGDGVVPLTLPDKGAAASGALRPIVSIARDKILLWSLSGSEGTLQKPKLTASLKEMDKLTSALAEIVKRRYKGTRDAADRTIVIQADGAIPMSLLAAAFTAVRTAADDSELFPDIQLSSGFE
jgi:hypothetical protein